MDRKHFVVLLLLFLAGCCFLPSPTRKKASDADVVGTWQYTADYGNTVITIEFKNDGTFHQVVTPAGQARQLVQNGTWTRNGADIELTDVLMEDYSGNQKAWVAEDTFWYLTDATSGKPPLVIFGGSFPDPDSWQEFKRIGESPQPTRSPG